MGDPVRMFDMDRLYFSSCLEPEHGYLIFQKIMVLSIRARNKNFDSLIVPKRGLKLAWIHPISQAFYSRGYTTYNKSDYLEIQWPIGLDGVPVPQYSIKSRLWREVIDAGLNTLAPIMEYKPGRSTYVPYATGGSLIEPGMPGDSLFGSPPRPGSSIFQGPTVTKTEPSMEEKLDKVFNFSEE